jgi:hypothetical protein
MPIVTASSVRNEMKRRVASSLRTSAAICARIIVSFFSPSLDVAHVYGLQRQMALSSEGFGQEQSENDDKESDVKSRLKVEHESNDHEHWMRQRNMCMVR